jgi:hypothetical protein
LLSLLTLQQDCVRAYRRYADTVAVLSAIYHILKQEPILVDYIAIEKTMKNDDGKDVTPDLIALYQRRTKGLMYELKWSLPFSEELLQKEIKEVKKYITQCSQWKNSTGKVDYHDFIIVCHIEDAQRAKETISKIATDQSFDFLVHDGFAVWSWIISSVRGGERREHLVLTPVHGKTRHAMIEGMVSQLPGLILPEESLTYLRSSFNFTREKPPVQYTIITLIQHIFSLFQDPRRGAWVYELTTDMIHEKAKILFPSWHEFDTQTIQMKRSWITEALETMYAIEMIGKPIGKPDSWLVPIPTLKTRKPVEIALCTKLARYQLKIAKRPSRRGRPRVRPIQPRAEPKLKRLDEFY